MNDDKIVAFWREVGLLAGVGVQKRSGSLVTTAQVLYGTRHIISKETLNALGQDAVTQNAEMVRSLGRPNGRVVFLEVTVWPYRPATSVVDVIMWT